MNTIATNIVPFSVIENKTQTHDGKSTNATAIPRMKTIKEVSQLTRLSYTFIRQLCLQNKIVYIKTGKKYLINFDKFLQFLNGGE